MSFSGSITIPAGLSPSEIMTALADMLIVGGEHPKEREDVAATARKVAFSLIAAFVPEDDLGMRDYGAVGWRVDVSGHVNKRHRLHSNWTPDNVHVYVTQIHPDHAAPVVKTQPVPAVVA